MISTGVTSGSSYPSIELWTLTLSLWQLKTIQHRGLPLTYNTTTDWAIQNNDLSLELYVLRLSLPIPEGIQAATGLIPAMFTNHSVKNRVFRISCGSFQSSLELNTLWLLTPTFWRFISYAFLHTFSCVLPPWFEFPTYCMVFDAIRF